eukprot:TRINITY_DN26694_c0_g1_i1.p17 TRINITY_DN26694_c0_g1~~TRINITY_DN26694_c0_g1_i1.p17  ORF type:complete len:110 (+),score=1.61 TRINITY_DN26694_c0_g1_i1:1551-1880(+)
MHFCYWSVFIGSQTEACMIHIIWIVIGQQIFFLPQTAMAIKNLSQNTGGGLNGVASQTGKYGSANTVLVLMVQHQHQKHLNSLRHHKFQQKLEQSLKSVACLPATFCNI